MWRECKTFYGRSMISKLQLNIRIKATSFQRRINHAYSQNQPDRSCSIGIFLSETKNHPLKGWFSISQRTQLRKLAPGWDKNGPLFHTLGIEVNYQEIQIWLETFLGWEWQAWLWILTIIFSTWSCIILKCCAATVCPSGISRIIERRVGWSTMFINIVPPA